MNALLDAMDAPDSGAHAPAGPILRLSIVVLTYNRAGLLDGCLESLAGLDDPGVPIEIVVVDDGSTDATPEVVRKRMTQDARIRCHRRPHGGIAAARNTGILASTGEVVAIVADDYLLAPDYASTIVSFFDARPDARIVRFRIAPADDRYLSRVGHAYQDASARRRYADGAGFRGHRALWRRYDREPAITTDHGLEAAGAAAFRREVFDRVGLFDESFERAEDSDLTARLRAAGIAVHYDPFHLVRHRYDNDWRSVLRTAYRSGRYRWRYYAKQGGAAPGWGALLRMRVASKASALYWACWRSAQTGSVGRFLACLPFMVLIEGANKAGFVAQAREERRLAGRARRASMAGARSPAPPVRLRAFAPALPAIPSRRLLPSPRPRRRLRLIATLMVRDEARYLPGLLANLAPQVDGIVALDDGSTDATAALLAASPLVVALLRDPPERERWDEPGGHRRLVAAAVAQGADWILSIDADERVERDFRERAERVIRRGRWFGFTAYALTLRELWDAPDRYRTDGVWGRKRVARLFRARADHRHDDRPLHAAKARLQGKVLGRYPPADLVIYHLRMIRPEDRIARRDRYLALDPQARWQPGIGYDYLADERGLALAPVPPERGWREA